MVTWVSGLYLAWAMHPIHSSSATITAEPDGRRATIEIRAFADDFPPGADSALAAAYLGRRFALGRPAATKAAPLLRRIELEGPVVVMRLTIETPRGLSGSSVWHGVLAERFTDQVNIVQARYEGRSVTLLFTARDGAKPLP